MTARRAAALLAVCMLALLPSAQALCDAICAAPPAVRAGEGSADAHCPSHDAPAPDAPADPCEHDHAGVTVAAKDRASAHDAPAHAAAPPHLPSLFAGVVAVAARRPTTSAPPIAAGFLLPLRI